MRVDVPYLATSHPRVLAHRGLALGAPENTLLAFLKALAAGATHLETDVHTSADGVAIVSHDPDLQRLVHREAKVGDLTVDELQQIDLGVGQTFCTLAEALETFPEAHFNIDIKDDRSAVTATSAVMRAGAAGRVLITSFSQTRRRAALDLLPGAASSASMRGVIAAVIAAKVGAASRVAAALADVVAVQVPMRQSGIRIVTPRFIDTVHAAGREVHVWTVNDVAAMTELLDAGVDGLITDRADLAVGLLHSRSHS